MTGREPKFEVSKVEDLTDDRREAEIVRYLDQNKFLREKDREEVDGGKPWEGLARGQKYFFIKDIGQIFERRENSTELEDISTVKLSLRLHCQYSGIVLVKMYQDGMVDNIADYQPILAQINCKNGEYFEWKREFRFSKKLFIDQFQQEYGSKETKTKENDPSEKDRNSLYPLNIFLENHSFGALRFTSIFQKVQPPIEISRIESIKRKSLIKHLETHLFVKLNINRPEYHDVDNPGDNPNMPSNLVIHSPCRKHLGRISSPSFYPDFRYEGRIPEKVTMLTDMDLLTLLVIGTIVFLVLVGACILGMRIHHSLRLEREESQRREKVLLWDRLEAETVVKTAGSMEESGSKFNENV